MDNGLDEACMKKHILNAVSENPEADMKVQIEYAMRLAGSENQRNRAKIKYEP